MQGMKSTDLKEIPAKWVIEWKEKEGKLVIKCRLCMKGFAERNQHRMQTFSPTASRTGHRMVAMQAALRGTPLASSAPADRRASRQGSHACRREDTRGGL